MSLLLPFVKDRSESSGDKAPLPSFCDDCALRFTEERRKNADYQNNSCAHQNTDGSNQAASMSSAFWQSLLYSYKS